MLKLCLKMGRYVFSPLLCSFFFCYILTRQTKLLTLHENEFSDGRENREYIITRQSRFDFASELQMSNDIAAITLSFWNRCTCTP